MSNTATNNEIYANGRTYPEHCAWLDSLVGDEYRIVHLPIGHLFNLVEISYLKYILLKLETTAQQRLRALDAIAICDAGSVTQEAVAAIEPCCESGREIMRELYSLPMGEQTWAFRDGDVFRILSRLNPSLLTALRLCDRGPVPEVPRNGVLEAAT
jgi:hypothetical protein